MFHFERTARTDFLWKFGHGKYADYWVFLHIATGAFLGATATLLYLPFAIPFSCALLGMFLYEIWENIAKIGEDVENAIVDVITGGVGYIIGYYCITSLSVEGKLFSIVLIGLACLGILYAGWKFHLQALIQKGGHAFKTWSTKTPAGRWHAFRDTVLFSYACIFLIPIPLLYQHGPLVTLAWILYAGGRTAAVLTLVHLQRKK
jgi:hypothetical protein